jgi:hypothetical protein
MAEKNDEATVTVNEEAGTGAAQVKPTSEKSAKDIKASILHEPDKALHPSGDPEHAADKTSVPGPEYPPIERPPVSTTDPGVPILRSLVTGAGEHVPPDPGKYDEMGRLRDTV